MTDIGYWMLKQEKELKEKYRREEEAARAKRRFRRRRANKKDTQEMDTDCDASLANLQEEDDEDRHAQDPFRYLNI